ncbi:MAG: Dipeptide transport ATP-binding protein DppD [Paracidovorax wautersii]|uniref:Dipeptide transport ATP-binding protein DppD n=1 Tax=Paracidovorax wautersii TaxID=1177982 RepID=A0A7V8FPJ6_9BURK|nr:MAG: Dipeptide transport ATP-binding protein DppD [Paracidovorax wautersii]
MNPIALHPGAESGRIVLAAQNLGIAFRRQGRWLEAVSGFDLTVRSGETVALVGESGCGKSITALALTGLLPDAARIISGRIELLGEPVSAHTETQWRGLRGRRIAMIFQDPMSALNPVLTVGEQLIEAILSHRTIGRAAARAEATLLLAQVQLPDPAARLDDYPHQLSGGMRQRVLIAMAISNRPEVLIADEPTTALDATVQAEILTLLREIQHQTRMALVLITHDLPLVARWADRAVVMYAGRKVEERDASALLQRPLHPYTQALIRARPERRPRHGARQRLTEIPGLVPALGAAGPGCAFAGRCSLAVAQCHLDRPAERVIDAGWVACHLTPHDQQAGADATAAADARERRVA